MLPLPPEELARRLAPLPRQRRMRAKPQCSSTCPNGPDQAQGRTDIRSLKLTSSFVSRNRIVDQQGDYKVHASIARLACIVLRVSLAKRQLLARVQLIIAIIALSLVYPIRAGAVDDPLTNIRYNLKWDRLLLADVVAAMPATSLVTTCTSIRQLPPDRSGRLCGITGAPDAETRQHLMMALVEEPGYVPPQTADAKQDRELIVDGLLASDAATLQSTYQAVIDERKRICSDIRPQIHNVGNRAILTFETKQDAAKDRKSERAIRIPIDGYQLDPRCVSIGVQIEGTVPISRFGQDERDDKAKDFYVTEPTPGHPDVANIVLLEPYINRLQSEDTLSVSVNLSNRYSTKSGARKVAYAKRSFTLYEVGQYRALFLKSRIGPHDFTAFPLPEKEAESLFGPIVARDYFTVRLSIRNTDNEAKLVSTGLIRATGTALIEPKNPLEPSFSVPVTVVPHSLQQIYTVLQDDEVNQPRPTVFRTLEFIGALASGINAATAVGVHAAKNIGLFTGIGIPEAKKLWPDRWPGYERNIVNYAMPDLLKVGASSVADHKFLFFSKRDIDGLVSDPYLFGSLRDDEKISGDIGKAKPDAYVISLAFDNLDIRFEKVFEIASLTTRDQALDLITDIANLIDALNGVKPWVSTNASAMSLFDLPQATWVQADKDLSSAVANEKKITLASPTNKDLEDNALTPIRKLLDAIKPSATDSALANDLLGNGQFGLKAISTVRDQVTAMTKRMTAGVDPSTLKDQVDAATKTAAGTQATIAFYRGVATGVKQLAAQIATANGALVVLQKTSADEDAKKKLTTAYQSIVATLGDITKQLPLPGVSLALK
jgi:hypothetical protein